MIHNILDQEYRLP